MELWQSILVGLGVTLICGLVGCLCYYYYRVHDHIVEDDEEQCDQSDDALSMNEHKKTDPLDVTPPLCLTELSAPPAHFFLRSNVSRQVPLPPPVVCPLNDVKDIRRCLSLSPFLGPKPSSPDLVSPSPAFSKITASWKRKS